MTFSSFATTLVAGDTNGLQDVFVRDLQSETTERVSVSTGGAQGNSYSYLSSMSADGRFVAFSSAATTLIAGDTNAQADIFVRDRQSGTTERVSVSTGGAQGNSVSDDPTLSADGRFVAFGSYATTLVAGDTNGFYDAFVRDRQSGTTARVSVSTGGAQVNNSSLSPAISADGRFVAFSSRASTLVAGDTNGIDDVFVRDRGAALTIAAFCFGDGTGIACPCANTGAPGKGCANSGGESAQLTASGPVSVASNTLVLTCTGMMPGSFCIFRQGTGQQNGGLGVLSPGSDGLDCIAGAQIRLGRLGTFGGSASMTNVAVAGAIPPTGGVFNYQSMYRNHASFCTPATLNGSNGVTIHWTP